MPNRTIKKKILQNIDIENDKGTRFEQGDEAAFYPQ